MYEQLRRDHQELSEIAEELRQRTRAPMLADASGLGRCRWRLSRTLARHLALEDAHVYARLKDDARPGVVAVSRRYQRELGRLHASYLAHMAEWTGDAIARDWRSYCRATAALLDALEARIACEENELYPLIAPRNGLTARAA